MSRSPCPDCPGCPSCGESLTESMCGKRLECLHCGAVFGRVEPRIGHTRAEQMEAYTVYGVLPEDPDDRPYIWDIEEDLCP